jgi:hypothetical protein
MSRSGTPTYRQHKASGQAVVTLAYPGGARRDVYLGAWRSPESRAEYTRVLAEWQSAQAGRRPLGDWSVNEVILAFLRHADQHYRRADGSATNEIREYRCSLRPLRTLYGLSQAAAFGPLALKAVREHMISSGLSRSRRDPVGPNNCPGSKLLISSLRKGSAITPTPW